MVIAEDRYGSSSESYGGGSKSYISESGGKVQQIRRQRQVSATAGYWSGQE